MPENQAKPEHVAVVGSRDFPNPQAVRDYVNSLPISTVIVSGHGGVVDLTAEDAANKRGMKTIIHPAKWRVNGVYNPAAGHERNALIVRDAHRVVAFWDGLSGGTRNTIARARGQRMQVDIHLPGDFMLTA